jgi:hypothetical protein
MLEKNKSKLKRHIYRKLKLKYDNLWRSEINDTWENKKIGNKLRTYCSFKKNIILEKYLLILNDEQRVLHIKFRISAHKLEIEKGRYIGLKVEDRICQLCKDDIEDEVHFLLQCPSLQKERWEIIKNINEINNFFYKSLDNRSKLVWLMSTEDSTIIKKTGRLLLDLHTKRNLLLKKNKVIRK